MQINTIYNEDCIKTMNRMDDNYVNLVVTSPPYDNLRLYDGYKFNYNETLRSIYRILQPGGVLVWVVGDSTVKGSETGTSFRQALCAIDIGYNLHDTMIYRKINYVPLTHNRYEQEFEYMFILSKGKPTCFNPIMVECKTKGQKTTKRTFYQTNDTNSPSIGHKNLEVKEQKIKGNVWDFSTNAGAKGHPAQFPEQLATDHILSWSNPGDTVYDPFMGSGTVAKMALLNNRDFIGSEVSKNFCDIIDSRLKLAKNTQATFII